MKTHLATNETRHRKYLDLALKVALRCPYENRYRLGCVIVQRGVPVSIGWNNEHKTHPRASKYNFQRLHAELSALIGVEHSLLHRATAYVARPRKISRTGLARPCPLCEQELFQSGISRIYYTTNNDDIGWIDR